jgi:hypothetical protein
VEFYICICLCIVCNKECTDNGKKCMNTAVHNRSYGASILAYFKERINKQLMGSENCFNFLARLCKERGYKTTTHVKCHSEGNMLPLSRVERVWLREGRWFCSCLGKYLVGYSRFCHARCNPPCNMLAVSYPYSPRTFLNFLLLLLLLLLPPPSPSLLPRPPSIFIFGLLLPR